MCTNNDIFVCYTFIDYRGAISHLCVTASEVLFTIVRNGDYFLIKFTSFFDHQYILLNVIIYLL